MNLISRLRPSIIIFLFSTTFSGMWSQSNQVRFEHITSEDGLSANVVNCIFQDSQGYMWFGTNDGLNRYDGYNFTTFKPSPDQEKAINSNLVFTIAEDSNGHLWIGTTGSGLNCFDPLTEEFTQFQHEPGRPATLSSNHIISLATDQKGRIWVGTLNGVNLIIPGASPEAPPKIMRINMPDNRPRFSVFSIAEDKGGTIWFGTRYGLYKGVLRDKHSDFYLQKIKVGNNPRLTIKSIKTDKYGRLILASGLGLFYQSKKGENIAFERFSEIRSQQALVLDNQGKLWSGTYKGLMCFESLERNVPLQFNAAFTVEVENPNSLNNNVIKSLYKDKTGIIWIGTNGGGVNKFDPERKNFLHFGLNLRSNGNRYRGIRSMLEDSKGNIWVGTEGGGLFWQPAGKDDGSYQHFSPIGNSSSPFVLAEVTEGDQKYIYVGSESSPSLQKINITGPQPILSELARGAPGSVFSILQDRQQQIWIGSYNGGLRRWLPKADGSFEETHFQMGSAASNSLSNNIIRKIHEDRKGNIWIGTADGLNMIEANQASAENPEFNVFKNLKNDPSSLSHNYILDIYESSIGELWVGTFGGGLNKLTLIKAPNTAYFTRYMEKDGLSNNSVKSIEEDFEGNLWIATNRGLSKFNPREESFQNYSSNDGLQASEFSEVASTQRASGELLFGGVNGFNAFYPENIQSDDSPPEVLFTKLQVHNQEVHPGEKIKGRVILSKVISATDEITLKYSQNDFSIEFAALHYSSPKQNQYAYKLEGYHQDWITVSADKRHATFTNLRHGRYTLLVRASNGDGIWTPQPAELKIRIKPPLWLTWYAFVFYGLLILGALLWFRRYTVISIHEKHKLVLEHMEREKLEELNQMKLSFFTNISHELRTPLTLIINPLEYILEKGKTVSQEKLQQQYHYMYKNAKYLLRLVNQLLDFRKLDRGSLNLRVGKGDLVDFIKETTEPFQFLASKKDIHFHIAGADSHIYTFFDPDVVEKVMYNLLSNAFKFTPEDGHVVVNILERDMEVKSISGPFVEIRVKDDGPGISKKRVKKIFERFYKEGAKKENKDGAGIGLAYSKSLVELHHGTINLESVKGEGACFVVRLPMNKNAYLNSEIDQQQLENFKATSDPLEYMIPEPVSKVTTSAMGMDLEEREKELPLLLFVDDNTDIRRFIKDGFQHDFRIITAEDGEKGYEIAVSSLPDIIVSDIMMPNMNGIELCETLKTNSLTSHIPIILLTAKSTAEDELKGLRTGADAYVVKPFKLDILRAQLLNIYLQRERLKQRFRQEVILAPKDITVTSADEEFLKKAMSFIEDHMADSEFNVEALVKEMHISRSKLYLKLKALTGQSSSEFIRTVRLKRAIQLLEKSDYTIKEIMYMTGFNTASYFSKCFKKQFGVVPSEYLRKQKDSTEVMNVGP